jgi:hypothetical protein
LGSAERASERFASVMSKMARAVMNMRPPGEAESIKN